MLLRRARRMEANLIRTTGMLGASLTETRLGKAASDKPALEPYWGKPAVRNLRGDGGNVGIIRSPVRASIPPDRDARVFGLGPDGCEVRATRHCTGLNRPTPKPWRPGGSPPK